MTPLYSVAFRAATCRRPWLAGAIREHRARAGPRFGARWMKVATRRHAPNSGRIICFSIIANNYTSSTGTTGNTSDDIGDVLASR